MIDLIDLIFKIFILFFLAAASEMAFKKRFWGVMLLTLGFWLTFFRTTILRSIVIYAGIFNHTPQAVISTVQTALMGGFIVIFTDLIALLGTLLTFIFLASEFKKKRVS